MYQGEERIITIPGFSIAAREWGTGGGLPVLATHGWLDNAASFDFLAPLLKGVHVVAIDSPGCGYSSHRPLGVTPSVLDEIPMSIEIANALSWNRFVLLSHSKGGAIAQFTAAACPDRIAGLVLLDIVGMLTNEGEQALRRLRATINSVLTPPAPPTQFRDLKDAAEGRMVSSPIAYKSALALAERGTEEVGGKRIWNFDRRERSFVTFLRPSKAELKDILSGIEAPTCIVLAEEGIFKDRAAVQEVTAAIKNHVVHYVPGGHHVHMDDAQSVADIVNPFLQSLRNA